MELVYGEKDRKRAMEALCSLLTFMYGIHRVREGDRGNTIKYNYIIKNRHYHGLYLTELGENALL